MKGKGFYGIREGTFDIDVCLPRQPKRNPRSPQEAAKRSVRFKKSVSYFYSQVYAAMTGGKAWPLYSTEITQIAHGIERRLHPDVVKITSKGRVETEIKVTARRSSALYCGYKQVENYFYKLLERLEKGQEAPRCDYAFFRYGEKPDMNLWRLPTEEIEQILCEKTRQAVFVPSNLALFIFLCSQSSIQDHSSSKIWSGSNYHTYFSPHNSIITRLSKEEDVINRMIEESSASGFRFVKGVFESHDLFLEQLGKSELKSPKINVNGRELRTFPITCFELSSKDYKNWLTHFSENHERILRTIGIRDLYAESLAETRREGCSD